MRESLQSLCARAESLKAQGRLLDALVLYEQAKSTWPLNAVVMHNIAATLLDIGRYDDSVDAATRALNLGIKAPETHLVLARGLLHSGHTEHAQTAYRKAIALRPDMSAAHYELAQLVWMMTGDQNLALKPLFDAVQKNPDSSALNYALSQALSCTGDKQAAAQLILDLADRGGATVELLAHAADLLLETGALDAGLNLAIQAFQADRSSFAAVMTLARAGLATGDAEGAGLAIRDALALRPLDQHALALQASLWRMLGDPRFEQLYDYQSLVRSYLIEPPSGWQSRTAYLHDLATELKAAHQYHTHPFGHSVRQGSQLPHVFSVQTPAIQAFRQVLKDPVDAHLAHLGSGPGPLCSRNTGAWQIQGIWSVLLRTGGFHIDHVHQEGWLSSAFYVELPDTMRAGFDDKAGWIRFGESGSRVKPPQKAQYFVQPQPGMLVLFPSYMWHGTVPISGQQTRLTMALDIVPA